jgi:hypothetical protein
MSRMSAQRIQGEAGRTAEVENIERILPHLAGNSRRDKGVFVPWGTNLAFRILFNQTSPPLNPLRQAQGRLPRWGGKPNSPPSGGSWRGEKTSVWSHVQVSAAPNYKHTATNTHPRHRRDHPTVSGDGE